MKLLNLALLTGALILLVASQARATDLCGSYATTQTITNNSQLTCDVKCNVSGAPCIRFGADSITLHLDGFTLTGRGGLNSCTDTALENGISTKGGSPSVSHSFVRILGPGLVTRFNGSGIVLNGGSNNTVRGVAVSLTCENGIVVTSSNSAVKNNSVSRASLSGSFYDDIAIITPGTGNVVKNNEVVGAGKLIAPPPPGSTGGYGIFVNSTNNSFVENASLRNSLGIWAANSGNTFDGNQALGNRPYGDIFDPNSLGSNAYHDNLCQTSSGADKPTCPNLPEDVVGHQNP